MAKFNFGDSVKVRGAGDVAAVYITQQGYSHLVLGISPEGDGFVAELDIDRIDPSKNKRVYVHQAALIDWWHRYSFRIGVDYASSVTKWMPVDVSDLVYQWMDGSRVA